MQTPTTRGDPEGQAGCQHRCSDSWLDNVGYFQNSLGLKLCSCLSPSSVLWSNTPRTDVSPLCSTAPGPRNAFLPNTSQLALLSSFGVEGRLPLGPRTLTPAFRPQHSRQQSPLGTGPTSSFCLAGLRVMWILVKTTSTYCVSKTQQSLMELPERHSG